MRGKLRVLVVAALCVLLLFGAWIVDGQTEEAGVQEQEQVQVQAAAFEAAGTAGSGGLVPVLGTEEELSAWEEYLTFTEDQVYSFLQGPRSWSQGISWSGEWCEQVVQGLSFGGFGCGLVCMANIYSSLSPYECSPWDMFTFATQVTDYYPSSQSGAIDWECMKAGLQQAGFTCGLFYKPDTYEEFQQHMSQVDTAIVLVTSNEDDTFWKDTSGHYVNIWLYQEEQDTVFLAEPGSPENNRSRIPLSYVYDALKTSSQFQYLAVWEYEEENNTWKRDGIDENWNKP